jgi:hypothetical protein
VLALAALRLGPRVAAGLVVAVKDERAAVFFAVPFERDWPASLTLSPAPVPLVRHPYLIFAGFF